VSTDLPNRGPWTDALVQHLRTALAPLLVGDGERPKDAGWSGNQPGQGNFVASVQLDTLDGVPGQARERVASQHSDWRLRYRMSSVGGLRNQADKVADQARAAALTFPHGRDSAKVEQWVCQAVYIAQQAPVQRKAPTGDWADFAVDDVVELWLTRSRT
jgi:hypothetical protein